MFKLQRLEITGFKSFADYTEIVFTGNGITAVVGPNGCGKSNVSDAIAWVLGEQRAKSLRGEEMKDVVFQGTSRRKSSGMAEVVLHLVRDEEFEFASDEEDLSDIDEVLGELDEKSIILDEPETEAASETITDELTTYNSPLTAELAQAAQVGSIQTVQTKIKTKRHWKPRSFALDFAPGEAVSVTRRLYLSGESEYQLNGKSCRLRDIQDLFAGTGLSGAHYALIEQGKIGQILSSKPSDRRNLIEEAAGISKFRTRQRAAETRLESAKTNLSRISDIVAEIEKQANGLHRQAAKTRRYKIMREEFRALLRHLFAAEGRHLTELVGELDRNLEEATKTERAIFSQVAEKDKSFREATNEARKSEENLSALRAAHAENALQRDRNQRDRQYKTEQIENLEKRSAALKSEIEVTGQRLKLFKSEIERLKNDEQKVLAEAGKNEISLAEAENKYQTEVRRQRQIEANLEAVRAEVLQHTTSVERLTAIERQLENTIERLRERAEGLQREAERAAETHAEHEKEAAKLALDLSGEREKLSQLQTEKQELLKISGKARTVLQANEKTTNDLRENFSRTRHRLETLRELEEKHAVYAPSVQKLFEEQTKIGVKFLGTLADNLKVEEQAERAVESVFGIFLETVLVKTETDARKTLAYLSENNPGRIAVLVQSSKHKVQTLKSQSKHQKPDIKNFLGISDDFAALLETVFPREMAARLVENFDEAKDKDDRIFVNFDGDLMIGGKLFVVSGQATKSNEKNLSLLAFKRELRELDAALQNSSKEVVKSEKETEKARVHLSEQENKIVDLQSLIVKIEREALGLEIREKSIKQEIERAERHKKVVAGESKQIEKEISELEIKRADAQTNAHKAEQERAATSEKLAQISNKLSEARASTENRNSVFNEKRTLAATSQERRRSAQAALRRIENEQTEVESRRSRLDLEILETGGALRELSVSIKEIERKIELAETEKIEEQNELGEATGHLKLAREQADLTSSELSDLNKQAADARNERAALEIRQTEAITKLRNINEKCVQELNLSLVELVETEAVETDFDLDEARSSVEDLRQRLENFGAINMLALEELSETEERLLFLTAQRKDIIDGISAAEEALREIKERSREKFKEAFFAINRNFAEFFQELFGGGKGEMTLLEAEQEDVLEAGIEIVAQPPGKRLQNILLLSGGEKAMTAIALVMAIFRFRPAPFCLLDEVDAPLDDANVGRFVNKIAAMSEKTQFIVITHNKRTMEAARALYGVTMQEAGVSKVVSVRFE